MISHPNGIGGHGDQPSKCVASHWRPIEVLAQSIFVVVVLASHWRPIELLAQRFEFVVVDLAFDNVIKQHTAHAIEHRHILQLMGLSRFFSSFIDLAC